MFLSDAADAELPQDRLAARRGKRARRLGAVDQFVKPLRPRRRVVVEVIVLLRRLARAKPRVSLSDGKRKQSDA